jgi:hypothetical protein
MAVNFARILPRRPRPKALVAGRARPLWDRKRSSFACHSKVAGWNWRWAQSQPILTVGRCEAKPGPEDRLVLSIFGDGSTPIHGGEKYHRVMAKKVKEVPFTFNPAIKAN